MLSHSTRSVTTGGELVPIETEIHYKERGEGECDDADRGEDVAEMAPVRGHEIQNAA